MKIAVSNAYGPQATKDGKIKYYYSVANDYDFSGNGATDVTSVENIDFFLVIQRFDCFEHRDSAKYHYENAMGSNWTAATQYEKLSLARLFVPTQEQAEEVMTQAELSESARVLSERLFNAAKYRKDGDKIMSGWTEYVDYVTSGIDQERVVSLSMSAVTANFNSVYSPSAVFNGLSVTGTGVFEVLSANNLSFSAVSASTVVGGSFIDKSEGQGSITANTVIETVQTPSGSIVGIGRNQSGAVSGITIDNGYYGVKSVVFGRNSSGRITGWTASINE